MVWSGLSKSHVSSDTSAAETAEPAETNPS